MKKLILLCVLAGACLSAIAQSPAVNGIWPGASKQKDSLEMVANPLSLQLHAGSQGGGLDVRYGVIPQISLRIGGSIMVPLKFKNVAEFDGFDGDNTIKGELSNVHFLADLSPFKTSVFKFVVGGAYLFKADGNIRFSANSSYNRNGVVLTSQEINNLKVDFTWKGVAPYAGIGLFKSFPNRLFNINLDLGTYFLQKPKSTVVGAKTAADNRTLENEINAEIKDYRFLPVVQLNFNFRIK